MIHETDPLLQIVKLHAKGSTAPIARLVEQFVLVPHATDYVLFFRLSVKVVFYVLMVGICLIVVSSL